MAVTPGFSEVHLNRPDWPPRTQENVLNQRVTVIGAGRTGSAVAVTLFKKGFDTTVWRKKEDEVKSFICWIVALLGFSIAAVGQMPQGAPLTKTTPGWVIRSNQNAQLMIGALAKYAPEYGSFLGVTAVDEHVLDLGPGFQERTRAALREAVAQLRQKLADGNSSRIVGSVIPSLKK